MREKFGRIIKTRYLFVYLLPLFFVLHNFTDSYDLVSVKEALIVLGAYILAAYFISIVAFLFFKDNYKAHLFTFSLLFINFFFGVVLDWLTRIAKNSILTKYVFLLPVTFGLLAIIFIWLKRKKSISRKLGAALNFFLLMILLVDFSWFILKKSKIYNEQFYDRVSLKTLPLKDKPNIYLIVADAYAGDHELKELFSFNNSDFKNALLQRGFYNINNSISNYNYTVFSMGSSLNMTYLRLKHNNYRDNLKDGLKALKANCLETYLKNNGYKINNLSVFQTDKQENDPKKYDYISGYQLLTSSTLLCHIITVIDYQLVQKVKSQFFDRGRIYNIQKNNDYVYSKTLELSKTISDTPRFVYTHLLMPHTPYYFDSEGNQNSFEKLLENNRSSKIDYLKYLQYANKKLITLVDEIQKNSTTPPIVILMSDHGFRQYEEPVNTGYSFSNIISIYFPDGNYSGFYDGMSNVNVFRTFVNTKFGQNLPLLKDSTIFLEQ